MRSKLLLAALVCGRLLPAQSPAAKIRAQQDTLDQIRQERAALEQRASELETTVHDLNEEVTNLDRRREATTRIVRNLDEQLVTITAEVTDASNRLSRAEGEMARKRATLHKRLVDIYERGPLYTTEVMLTAHSFGDLVARYKYLHLLALHDRTLVRQVEQLRDQIAGERQNLVQLQTQVAETRSDKAREEGRLGALMRQQAAALAQTQEQAQQAQERLAKLRKTEAQLTSTIAALEAARLKAERAARARAAAVPKGSSIKTRDYGKLDWPVQGPLLYSFGKAQTASNATIRWNGVGIKANVGAAVHSIAAGKVVRVAPLGTYGLTIIIDHGAGDYSVYGSLNKASVQVQQQVAKDEVIGTVGISDPDLGPHLHFEIRHGGPAVDPALWLRGGSVFANRH